MFYLDKGGTEKVCQFVKGSKKTADTYKNLPKQTLDNHKRKFHFDRNKIEHTTKIWCKAIAKNAERTGRTRTVSL